MAQQTPYPVDTNPNDGSQTCNGYTVLAGPSQANTIGWIQLNDPIVPYLVSWRNDRDAGTCRDFPTFAANIGLNCP